MQVHCISVSEHIWVGGCGPRGVGELPAGGIRASQGTFSSYTPFLARLHEVHRAIVVTSVFPVYVYVYVCVRVTLSVKVFKIVIS